MKIIINYFNQCFKWFGKYRLIFIINMILGFTVTAIHLVEPYLYALIITYLFNSEWHNIKNIFILMILCYVLNTVIFSISTRIEINIKKKVAAIVKKDLIKKMASIKPHVLSEYNDGKLLSIMINDSLLICGYVYSLCRYITDIFTIIIIGLILLNMNVLLTFLILSVFPFIYLINKKYGKKIKKESIEIYKKTDSLIGFIKTLITNLNDIKVNFAEKIILSKFNYELDDTIQYTIHRDNIQLKSSIITNIVNFIGNLLFLISGCVLIYMDKLLPGIFVAFSSYAKLFNSSMFSISTMYSRFQQEIVGIARILEFDKEYTKYMVDEELKLVPYNLPKTIIINNVSLSINNKTVLDSVSLDISIQQFVVLIGNNGSGKTSILNMMAGVYIPSSGSIYYDVQDIMDIKYSWIQKNVGYVKQVPIIYPVSIRDNMTLSSIHDVSDDKLIEICKDIQIYDDILNMPYKFDTIISSNYNLSTGQKKKVQLARILLKDSPIILLDEPLSNMDSHFRDSYKMIHKKYFEGKTIIVATHENDIHSICNKIIRISNGKLIDN